MNDIIKNILILFLTLSLSFVLLTCSADQKEKEKPIQIKGISLAESEARTPRETAGQVDIELGGMVADDTINSDNIYRWDVEAIDLGRLGEPEVKDLTEDKLLLKDKKKNYFLDISNDPLKALLTLYYPGYYRITLTASNILETKTHSIIIKSGNPEYPRLYLKMNIPAYEKSKTAVGKFYIKVSNSFTATDDLIELPASSISTDWTDTGIPINPFYSFSIQAGTHRIRNSKIEMINSVHSNQLSRDLDTVSYSLLNDSQYSFKVNPVVLKGAGSSYILSIQRSGKALWEEGSIYAGFLSWGVNAEGKDEFSFDSLQLKPDNQKAEQFLNNKYLVKLFTGSAGLTFSEDQYTVYFGPEGCTEIELDRENMRDYPGLPYGYLIGRAGKKGTRFPVGVFYNFESKIPLDIYEKDQAGNYSIIKTKNSKSAD